MANCHALQRETALQQPLLELTSLVSSVSSFRVSKLGCSVLQASLRQAADKFSLSNIRTVPFFAQGLLVSKAYTIQVNGAAFTRVISSTMASSSATLNLSSFPDGSITITLVRDSDAASVSVQIVKDTSSFVSISSPSNSIVTNQVNIAVRGTGEVGGRVVVTVQDSNASTPDVVSAPVTVDANGNWAVASVDISSLADGYLRITASIVDIYGNNAISSQVTIYQDTSVNVAIIAPSNLQFVVSDARSRALSISGFADSDSTVVVNINDQNNMTPFVSSGSLAVSPVGTWSTVMDVSLLSDGTLTFIAVATDPVGNVVSSAPVNLKKDTMPSGFTISSPSSDSTITQTQAMSLAISGTGEAGGRVSLRILGSPKGVVNKSVIVSNLGTWSTVVNISTLPNGRISITGTSTDGAGNSGQLPAVSINKEIG